MMLRIDSETKEKLDRILNHLMRNSVASTKDAFYHPFSAPVDYSEINELKRLETLLLRYQLVSLANPNERPVFNLFDLNLTGLGYECKTIDGYIKYLEEQAAIKQTTQSAPIINTTISGSSGVQVVNGSIIGSQVVNTNPTSVVNETKEVETKPKSKNIGDYIKDFFSSTIVKIVAGIVGAAVLAYLGFK